MKIAFAISNFDSEDANAEMTALYLDWARIPSLLGHDVTLYTLSEKGYSEDVMNGVKVVRFPFDPASFSALNEFTFAPVLSWFLPRSIELYRQLSKSFAQSKPDIIHCIKPLDALMFGTQRELPVVIQSVSPQFELMNLDFEKQYGEFDTSATHSLETLGYALADAITVPSKTLARVISEGTELPIDRIDVIAAPVQVPDEASTSTRRSESFPHILHAAGVEKLKGVDTLIEALSIVAQKYPEVKLSIAGEEPAKIGTSQTFADGVKQLALNKGLAAKVEFLGVRPRAEIRQRMSEADIFVFPLLYCGCPYACMEAMAEGLPIVATHAGAIAEYVEDGKSGLLIEIESASSLAESIIKFADNHELAGAFGQAARERVLTMCSPQKVAELTDALYKKAVKKFQTRNADDDAAIRNAVKHGLAAFDNLSSTPYLRRLFDEKFVEGAARSVADLHSPRIAFGRLGLAGGMAALALKAGKALSNNGHAEDLD